MQDFLPVLCRSADLRNVTTIDEIPGRLEHILAAGRLLKGSWHMSPTGEIGNSTLSTLKTRLSHPHLTSGMGFYRSSAEKHLIESYGNGGELSDPLCMKTPATVRTHSNHRTKSLVFLVPWMNMGGAEAAVLRLASAAKLREWNVMILLTMPFFHVDWHRQLALKNEWFEHCTAITPHVFDTQTLAPYHRQADIVHYLLSTRAPSHVILANSRAMYGIIPMIRELLPHSTIVDYNHATYYNWKGGGLPRYAANNSANLDLHFTASAQVKRDMDSWIDRKHWSPDKVRVCYIGADPDEALVGLERQNVRNAMRIELGIRTDDIVVLFAGRFVFEKRVDIFAETAMASARHPGLADRLTFVAVGKGPEAHVLEKVSAVVNKHRRTLIVRPPADGSRELQRYYAMSDVLLLPSVNEGIALVLYEAMMAGLVVMSTGVGGQAEILKESRSILLPDTSVGHNVTGFIARKLLDITNEKGRYDILRATARRDMKSNFTVDKFTSCVLDEMRNLKSAYGHVRRDVSDDVMRHVRASLQEERQHGLWAMKNVERDVQDVATIGVETCMCDQAGVESVTRLLKSIRSQYQRIPVFIVNYGVMSLGNDYSSDAYTTEIQVSKHAGGNAMLNATETEFLITLSDTDVLTAMTDLTSLATSLRKDEFDMVGMRIYTDGAKLPLGISRVRSTKGGIMTECEWDENDGPSVIGMRRPLRVHRIHSAFIARAQVLRAVGWRRVDEDSLGFFVRAWREKVKIGYLPSISIRRAATQKSECYEAWRGTLTAEQRSETPMVETDEECSKAFVEVVKEHFATKEL